ncbi:MAG: lipoyl domain-containing protein [Synergistaceae bacterium]|jgi:pyruvate/2-oxoglutarate dehydrogenase complex dihydrolipoamide acyltransferase (E2) component|nr:lipoyl domain-containing protein [Synergistaceae bacterium]
MAKIDVIVPDFAEGAKSIKLRKWFVKEGDTVKKDDIIAEAATDKISVDIESPADGKIASLLAEDGDRVEVGEKIAELEVV